MHDTLEGVQKHFSNIFIGKSPCRFCEEALGILVRESIGFLYIPEEDARSLMVEIDKKHDHHTYPAIILNGEFVGGCDKLKKKFNNKKY